MKYSKQRELVRDVVMQSKAHPTADDIYGILKPDNPNLSLGTVYRNLNALEANGDIRKLRMPKGSDRFDGNTCVHYHIICEKCGTVFDVELPVMEDMKQRIKDATGVAVTSHDLMINGICKNCRQESHLTTTAHNRASC